MLLMPEIKTNKCREETISILQESNLLNLGASNRKFRIKKRDFIPLAP